MEVINGIENVTKEPSASLTIGSFDGLHLGHQRIIQHMRKLEGPVTVLTFNPHPQAVVRPNQSPPPLLTSFEERIGLFRKLGVDRLIIIKFDKDFAKISPEDFIDKILYEKIGMAHIFVGQKHGFGHDRGGNVNLLQKRSEQHGFSVTVVDPVKRFGKVISSSRIRKLLLEGDALTAWRCLGRPYYVDGKVVMGDSRGKRLGFPTANLISEVPAKLTPASGIYATVTEVDGIRRPSVSHFGPRPTFKGANATMETHIIGFRREIYGKSVRVGLVDKLRDIMTFTSAGELVRQIRTDSREATQRLAELGFEEDARLRIQRLGKVLQ